MLRRTAPALAGLAVIAGSADAQPVGIGADFQVNTYTTHHQTAPAVAVHAEGTFTVAWASFAQAPEVAQRFDRAGAPLGAELIVTTSTVYGVVSAVAAGPSGSFVVAWTGADADASGISARIFDAGGNPSGGEFQVNASTTSYQYMPDVAATPAGNFVVVWESYGDADPDGEYLQVMGRVFDPSGAPLTGEFLVNVFSPGRQMLPAVATQPGGSFVVVWADQIQDGSFYGVFGRAFDASGNPRGGEFQVNTTTAYEQYHPDVATDAAGNFVVVWQGYVDGSDYGIFARLFDAAGSPLGDEFPVNTHTPNRQVRPSVAREPDGHFVVTWDSLGQLGSGAVTDIFGRRFRPDGTPIGGEFQVNTYTTGIQFRAALASQGPDEFVVVWNSAGQDGDRDGVFGRLFADLIFRDGFQAGS
jgi:hypothetical protein